MKAKAEPKIMFIQIGKTIWKVWPDGHMAKTPHLPK